MQHSQSHGNGNPMRHLAQDNDWIHPLTLDPSKIMTTPPGTASLDPSTQPVTANSTSDESHYHADGTAFPVMNPQTEFPSGLPFGQYNDAAMLGGLLNSTSMHMIRPQNMTVKEDSPTPFAFNVPPENSSTVQYQPAWNPWIPSNPGQPLQHHPVEYPPSSAVASHEAYPYPQTGNPHKVLPLTAHHQHMMQLQQVPQTFRMNTAATMSSTTSSELVTNHKKPPFHGFFASTPPNDLVQRSYTAVPPSSSYASQTFGMGHYPQRPPTMGYPATPLGMQPTMGYPITPLGIQPTMGYPVTPLDSRSRGVVVVQSLSTDGESRSPDDVEMTSGVKPEAEGDAVGRAGAKQGKKREPKMGPNFLTRLYDILSNPAYHHILHWGADGAQIVICKPKELEAHILPMVYKQSKFASFSRQLNIYGFMRKMTVKEGDIARDGDSSVWTHYELDQYSKRDQLMTYKRRVGPRNYSRKTVDGPGTTTGKQLPILGEGARYEFIPDPTPISHEGKEVVPPGTPCSPLQSLADPNSTTTTRDRGDRGEVTTARRIRQGHRMTAGTLPMPASSRAGGGGGGRTLLSPRSVPYGSSMARHAAMDRVPRLATAAAAGTTMAGGEGDGNPVVQGGLWYQMMTNPEVSPSSSGGGIPCGSTMMHPSTTFYPPPREPTSRVVPGVAMMSAGGAVYAPGTRYRSFPHQGSALVARESSGKAEILDGFEGMEIRSVVSLEMDEPAPQRDSRTTRTRTEGAAEKELSFTSYLNDYSTLPASVGGSMRVEVRRTARSRTGRGGGSLETVGAGMTVKVEDV